MCCLDKAVFNDSDCVTEQRFVAVKGHWVDGDGLEGLVCVCISL